MKTKAIVEGRSAQTRRTCSALCAAILLATNAQGAADKGESAGALSAKAVAARYGDAVALLLAVDQSGTPRRLGSGVFVSEDGLLITNLHVAMGLNQVRVRLSGGEERTTSKVVGYSKAQDLLVLRVRGGPTPTAILGNSDGISPGETIVVISNPEGLERSVSTGVVSGIRSLDTLRKIIQFTAPVSAGSSGGAIFDEGGTVIGIVSSQLIDGQNLNFGVPINDVKPLLASKDTFELGEIGGESRSPAAEAFDVNGIWNGVVSNFTHGVSSAIQFTLRSSAGSLSGEVLVSRPLYGSGPIIGTVEGNALRFRSVGEGFTIDWEGQVLGNKISGSYALVEKVISQRGTWWVVK